MYQHIRLHPVNRKRLRLADVKKKTLNGDLLGFILDETVALRRNEPFKDLCDELEDKKNTFHHATFPNGANAFEEPPDFVRACVLR